MGGYVAWRAGAQADGSDSLAVEVASRDHWPEVRALILIVSTEKKEVGSTEAMQRTVQTSTLFTSRPATVTDRMKKIKKAIKEKDFASFAVTTMQDSNSFHAVCLDSWPPVQYINDVSKAAMDAVHTINRRAGKIICAYTFDAGPNAVIYYLEKHTSQVAGVFRYFLPTAKGWQGEYGDSVRENGFGGLDAKIVRLLKAGISDVICTGVGEGPEKIDRHLIDARGRVVDADMDSV